MSAEIILVIIGAAVFLLGYLMPARKKDIDEEVQLISEDEVRKLIAGEVDHVKDKINDIVEETVNYSIEKAERAMERMTNEKIMAVNEYSDTVLEEINKNHKEVVFLYDMLNDKHDNLMSTINEATMAADEIRQTAKDAEITAHEATARIEAVFQTADEAEETIRAAESAALKVQKYAQDAMHVIINAVEKAKSELTIIRAAASPRAETAEELPGVTEIQTRRMEEAERQAQTQISEEAERQAQAQISEETERQAQTQISEEAERQTQAQILEETAGQGQPWAPEKIESQEQAWTPEETAAQGQSWMPEQPAGQKQVWMPEETVRREQAWTPEETTGREQSWMPEETARSERAWMPEETTGQEHTWMPETARSEQSWMPKEPAGQKHTQTPNETEGREWIQIPGQEDIQDTIGDGMRAASAPVKEPQMKAQEMEEQVDFTPIAPRRVEIIHQPDGDYVAENMDDISTSEAFASMGFFAPRTEESRKTRLRRTPRRERIQENPAAVDIQFAQGKDNRRNSNERILELHKAGKSNMAIAKELGLGLGEVKLVIDLFEGM